MNKIGVFLVVIVSFSFCCSYGQRTGEDTPVSWWIDKPVVKRDSDVIIRHQFHEIHVFKVDFNSAYADTSKHDTISWGIWSLNLNGRKIESSKWTWNSEIKDVWREFYPITKRRKKRNRIIEILEMPSSKFKFTHHLDSSGNISYTGNKFVKGKFMESRYFFDRIDYSYHDGLLQEAAYRNFWLFDDSNYVYTKFVFRYK